MLLSSFTCKSFLFQEFGGYFIINGNERIIRMLVLPRRNYVCLHVMGGGKGERGREREGEGGREGEREGKGGKGKEREGERKRERTVDVSLTLSAANGHHQAVMEGAWSYVHRVWHQYSMCEEGSNCSSKCVVM